MNVVKRFRRSNKLPQSVAAMSFLNIWEMKETLPHVKRTIPTSGSLDILLDNLNEFGISRSMTTFASRKVKVFN